MQLASQFLGPQLLEDQRDETAVRSGWPANHIGHSGIPKYPYVFGSRRHLSTAIIAAIIVVLSAMTAAYVCLLPRRMRKLKASSARRLSSSGDDECQEFLASMSTAEEKGEVGTSPSSTSSEGTGSGTSNKSRKRRRSARDIDEEVEGTKKPLMEEEQGIPSTIQSSQGASSLAALETSSFDERTRLIPYSVARGDLSLGGRTSADTEETVGADISTGTPPSGGLRESDWLGDYAETLPGVDEWFLNLFLDRPSAFLPNIGVETLDDILGHDYGGEGFTENQITAESTGLLENPSQEESLRTLQFPAVGEQVHPPAFVSLPFETLPSPSESSPETSEQSASHTHLFPLHSLLHLACSHVLPGASMAPPSSTISNSQSPAFALPPHVNGLPELLLSLRQLATHTHFQDAALPQINSSLFFILFASTVLHLQYYKRDFLSALLRDRPLVWVIVLFVCCGVVDFFCKAASSVPDVSEHPFCRLPRAIHSQRLIPFDFERAQCHTPLKTLAVVLQPIRAHLVKRELHDAELQSLIELAELLVRNVFNLGKFLKTSYLPYQLTEPLARRFVIADALWCICEVVGPAMKKEQWWENVMSRLFELPLLEVGVDMSAHHIASRLISALKVYVTGRRPGDREVVELKRDIFCSQRSPYYFRSRAFDDWKRDCDS